MTAATTAAAPKKKRHIPGFAQMQRIGRSLMLPIAALPAAALLLRFGAPDMLGADGVARYWPWMEYVAKVLAGAGGALFDNLPLLFAIGIAIGFAKKSEGATAVAGLVGYLVFQGVCKVLAPALGSLPKTINGTSARAALTEIFETVGSGGTIPAGTALPGGGFVGQNVTMTATTAAEYVRSVLDPLRSIDYGVLGGVVVGIMAALLYDRFYRTKLPTFLAFFGGRRFVPIVTSVSAMVVAVLMSLVYPVFNAGFSAVGDWVSEPNNQVIGGFVYGTANRLLVPLGLHHLLNSIPWFQVGDWTVDGVTYHGDIARFLHGDPSAGTFMTGFFPIMMFALPAAALAIWRVAKPSRRPVIGGIMISAALTAFLTGITEPLEFSFLYVALPLYIVHAVLTGVSIALVNALDLHMGFGFSAGATDFLLNLRLSAAAGDPVGHWGWMAPALIVLIGLAFAVIYYLMFYFGIKMFDFKTPGREDEGTSGDSAASILDDAQSVGAGPPPK